MKSKLYALATFVLAFTFGSVFAQEAIEENHECGTMQSLERLKKENPKLEKQMVDYEQQIQQWIASNPNAKVNPMGTIVIPTVVHIVWATSAENVSNTNVNGLMQALNEDYGRTNPDASSTPAVWQPIAVNTGIQFCLAQQDPTGAPSTGIERRQTTIASFTTDDKVKFFAQGGLNIWDPTRYFNIWLCDLTAGLGGYGEFPTGSPTNTFGNVTDYTLAPYGNWVATHESGHCFNLRHIWGDDGTACTGSDLVSDTPNQGGPTSSTCPSFPATDACSPSSPGFMFMNYMDYGGNGCKNLFTSGQSSRINAILGTPPYNALASSNGCTPVVLVANDAQCMSIQQPQGLRCSVNIIPQVTIRNFGNNTLTSCTINYQIDANPPSTYAWTGSLASLATASVTLPAMVTTAGAHTFTCYTTMPNGVSDANPGNDSQTSNFNVVTNGQALPFFEGFEGATFPPAGWTAYNPDGVYWDRTTGAAYTGVASMWYESIAFPVNGKISEMTAPNFDMTTVGSPQLTFRVAYQMLSDPSLTPNWSDTLRVMLSTDCGTTWTVPYFKYSTNLTTVVPTFSTTPFVPASPTQWRLETISLSSIASSTNAMIKWKVTSDYENNLYVDDINITGLVGLDNSSFVSDINVYPNPSNGTLNVNCNFEKSENLKVYIYNVLGAEMGRTFADNTKGGLLTLDMSAMPDGVYFVKVSTDSETFTKKIVLNK